MPHMARQGSAKRSGASIAEPNTTDPVTRAITSIAAAATISHFIRLLV